MLLGFEFFDILNKRSVFFEDSVRDFDNFNAPIFLYMFPLSQLLYNGQEIIVVIYHGKYYVDVFMYKIR